MAFPVSETDDEFKELVYESIQQVCFSGVCSKRGVLELSILFLFLFREPNSLLLLQTNVISRRLRCFTKYYQCRQSGFRVHDFKRFVCRCEIYRSA